MYAAIMEAKLSGFELGEKQNFSKVHNSLSAYSLKKYLSSYMSFRYLSLGNMNLLHFYFFRN